MIEIYIPQQRKFDEQAEIFIDIPETTLKLEHSLLSIKKWESKWHIPFLTKKDKTMEQYLSYISCMTINNKKVDDNVYRCITSEDFVRIIAYIEDPMTATTFSNYGRIGASNKTGEIVTAETIYYWMISYNIPVEFQKWHLKQLLTLIRMIHIKSGGEKKMGKKEAALERARLNMQRRKALNTRG